MLETYDHGTVRELRMDRPPVNALDPTLVDTLTGAIADAGMHCEAIVLSGREGLFSAGLDVPELLRLDRPALAAFWEQFFRLLETLARSPVPVAAAITGHAPAGGAVLSLFCDHRVMSRGDYRIGLNETRVGLVVPEVIRRALVRLTGTRRAAQLVVSGALLEPEEALHAGLVDELADNPEAAVAASVEWCVQLLALPRKAMLGNRARSRRDLVEPFGSLGDEDIAAFVDGWFKTSTQEILRAMVDRLKKR